MVGVIVAAAGVVVSAVASVFSWLQGEESQETQAKAQNQTIFAEQTIFIQKSHGIMFMLDAGRNLARINATMKRYGLNPNNMPEQLPSSEKTAMVKTIQALQSASPITIDAKMPSYNKIIDPEKGQTYWTATDDGFVMSQGRFLLPNLNNPTQSQTQTTSGINPIIPGAVGAAIGYVARGPVGAAVGAAVGAGGGMLYRKKDNIVSSISGNRMTVRDFLLLGTRGRTNYERHLKVQAEADKFWAQKHSQDGHPTAVNWYINTYRKNGGTEHFTWGLEYILGRKDYQDDQIKTVWAVNDEADFRSYAMLMGVYND